MTFDAGPAITTTKAARGSRHWRLFADWCTAADHQPLPATADTPLAFLAEIPAGPATVLRRIRAVDGAHRAGGWPPPSAAPAFDQLLRPERPPRFDPVAADAEMTLSGLHDRLRRLGVPTRNTTIPHLAANTIAAALTKHGSVNAAAKALGVPRARLGADALRLKPLWRGPRQGRKSACGAGRPLPLEGDDDVHSPDPVRTFLRRRRVAWPRGS